MSTRIIVQVAIFFLYGLSPPVSVFLICSKTQDIVVITWSFAWSVLFNSIALMLLIKTLSSICDLQLSYNKDNYTYAISEQLSNFDEENLENSMNQELEID